MVRREKLDHFTRPVGKAEGKVVELSSEAAYAFTCFEQGFCCRRAQGNYHLGIYYAQLFVKIWTAGYYLRLPADRDCSAVGT